MCLRANFISKRGLRSSSDDFSHKRKDTAALYMYKCITSSEVFLKFIVTDHDEDEFELQGCVRPDVRLIVTQVLCDDQLYSEFLLDSCTFRIVFEKKRKEPYRWRLHARVFHALP